MTTFCDKLKKINARIRDKKRIVQRKLEDKARKEHNKEFRKFMKTLKTGTWKVDAEDAARNELIEFKIIIPNIHYVYPEDEETLKEYFIKNGFDSKNISIFNSYVSKTSEIHLQW